MRERVLVRGVHGAGRNTAVRQRVLVHGVHGAVRERVLVHGVHGAGRTCVSPKASRFSMGKRSEEENVYCGSLGNVVVI